MSARFLVANPLICALTLFCCAAACARDSHKLALSENFFTNGQIPTINIEISGASLTALRQNNREYVRATVREADKIYKDVGVHLKGAAGSFRAFDEKPALTLNFDRFNPRQKFYGLDKLHLNNSVQDPSYMTEIICGELFRAAGVPAARGTFARVSLNGRDLGFCVLKEGFGKEFLQQYFSKVHGNLYDGGFLRDITDPLQRISGEETKDVKDFSDLKALATAAREPDPITRMERLDKVLDLDRFISFIAMEILTWHWDGYALKKNNYRVFHDLSTGKMVFFPHGMDQMFWEPNGSLLPPNIDALVAKAVLDSPEGKDRYLARIGQLYTNVFKIDVLTNRVNELQQRIRPLLAAISPEQATNHDRAVIHLKNQIVARARFLERTFNLPPPMTLHFGSNGMAQLTDWRIQNTRRLARLEKISEAGKTLLHIDASGDTNCVASWRCRVQLQPGEYHFQALARSARVVPLSLKDKKGIGAGIRISEFPTPRTNSLAGNSDWTRILFDFAVQPGDVTPKDLLCELRALEGEVWFDLNSLKLTRK